MSEGGTRAGAETAASIPPSSRPPHQHQLLQAGRQVLLPVRHLAGHYLLLQLPVDLLADQDEAAAGAGRGAGGEDAQGRALGLHGDATGRARRPCPIRGVAQHATGGASQPPPGAHLSIGRLRLHWLVQSSKSTISNRVPRICGNSSGRCRRCSAIACTAGRAARPAVRQGSGRRGQAGRSAAWQACSCLCAAPALPWQAWPLERPAALHRSTHCCRGGGRLAARLVPEVVARQVVDGRRALQGGGVRPQGRIGWGCYRKAVGRRRALQGGA